MTQIVKIKMYDLFVMNDEGMCREGCGVWVWGWGGGGWGLLALALLLFDRISTIMLFSNIPYNCHSCRTIEPDDYTSVNASFIFVNGTSRGGPGSQMCIEVSIGNDSLVEFDEFFLVRADSPDPNINTTLISTDVFILDDDGKYVLPTKSKWHHNTHCSQ